MKKLFTLAAALLACFTIKAADAVLALPTPVLEGDNDVYTYSTTSEIKVKNYTTVKFEIPSATLSGEFNVKGSGTNDKRFLYIHKENGATKDESRKIDFKTSYQAFTFTSDDILTDGGKYYLVFSTSDDYKLNGECAKLAIPSAPATTGVASVTVSGPSACVAGYKIKFTAAPDVKADSYQWSINGADQAGATSQSFEYTPASAGTFSIVCKAKNSLNSDWVASSALALEVKERLAQVEVSESTTWDWTKASSETALQLTASTSPAKGDTLLMANFIGMNNNADFNSQALLFAGEFLVREGKYCQGSLVQFKTTVAGKLSVSYSNTGNRSNESDRRFLNVNGKQIGNGSMKQDANDVTESDIEVPAGDVTIVGVLKDGDPAKAPQYLRIYKVEFTKGTGTALDNTVVNAKAIKTFENGQLIIIKNGVKYNALGEIVK